MQRKELLAIEAWNTDATGEGDQAGAGTRPGFCSALPHLTDALSEGIDGQFSSHSGSRQ